jgi:hypothetical protein
MPERRSAVMIMADAWWEALNGSLQKARVRIVNKSASGACIRSKGVIEAGAKLRIQSRWDEFSGVSKYCRSDFHRHLIPRFGLGRLSHNFRYPCTEPST